jgi:hypothetical protein
MKGKKQSIEYLAEKREYLTANCINGMVL